MPLKEFAARVWDRVRPHQWVSERWPAKSGRGIVPQRDPTDEDVEQVRSEIAALRHEWRVDPGLARNFVPYDRPMLRAIRAALLKAGGDMFSREGGARDLADHLFRRLELDRVQCVPWLSSAFPLRSARILEVGCGTGSSTASLAEQGCELIALDIDSSSLEVAATRCRVMGLRGVDFRCMNGTEIGARFPPQSFDAAIFVASLEHMTLAERRQSLAAAWSLIAKGGHLVVTDTPNRLWHLDEHTSFLSFLYWLPDEMAAEYMQKFSPRKDLAAELAGKDLLAFQRAGRGVSFHELELAIAPLAELEVLSGKHAFLRERNPSLRASWARSDDPAYIRVLSRSQPGVPELFYERSLEVVIRK